MNAAHPLPPILRPPVFGPGPQSERAVYEALARGLAAPWRVWWALAYSGPAAGGGTEGEIDFLLAHPRHGLLVIEVKGGALACRDGQWFQDGRRLRESPAMQACRNRHALLTGLRRGLRLDGFPWPLAHAVWLPFAGRPAAEPPDLAGITLYGEDLLDPEPPLLRILAALGRPAAPEPLPVARLDALLTPALAFRPGWETRRTLADARLARLTHEQALAFGAFDDFPRLRVRGVAGSGKTFLALRRAQLLAARGKRVLLLCYNLLLAERLKALVADLPGVRAEAVNELFAHLLGRTDDGSRGFWHALARDALPLARALGERRAYDAVIVDEGQDFSPDLWAAVKAIAHPDAQFVVFYDPGQNIFRRDLSALPAFPWPEAVLTVNCRNTRAVFEALRPYAPPAASPLPEAPPGEGVETYRADSVPGLRARLDAILDRLLLREGVPPDDVILIGAHVLGRMSLDATLARHPGVRYYTYRKFKGLEAPILILLDLSDDPAWDRAARYTAISRAVHRLVILELRRP